MRMREIRKQSKIGQGEIAERLGFHQPVFSMIEKGRVLPTPETLIDLCQILNTHPLEIYEKHEIDLVGCMGAQEPLQPPQASGRVFVPKVQFRRSEAAYKCLQRHVLREAGYKNAQEWFDECVEALSKRVGL